MTGLYLRYRARMLWSLLRPASRRDWGHVGLVAFLLLVYGPLIVVLFAGLQTLSAHIAATRGLEVLHRLLYLPAAAHGVLLLFLALN
ncbi:MAG: hypothetical protein AB1505_03875, partial [Candidatus Latescibacterota bacterium]